MSKRKIGNEISKYSAIENEIYHYKKPSNFFGNIFLLCIAIILIIGFIAIDRKVNQFIDGLDAETQTIKIENTEEKIVEEKSCEEKTGDEHLCQFVEIFGKNKYMLAVAIAESHWNVSTINYNCIYKIGNKSNGVWQENLQAYLNISKVYSKKGKGMVSWTCMTKAHEKFAYSVDVGLLQVNSIHGAEIGNEEKNLQIAKEIYDEKGTKAWSSVKMGLVGKEELQKAENLLSKLD